MSFLRNQKSIGALVHVNPPRVQRASGIYAVIQIYFNDQIENTLSCVYSTMPDGSRGFMVPAARVHVNNVTVDIPVIAGELWQDLADFSNAAITRIRETFPNVEGNVTYQVTRTDNQTSVIVWTKKEDTYDK